MQKSENIEFSFSKNCHHNFCPCDQHVMQKYDFSKNSEINFFLKKFSKCSNLMSHAEKWKFWFFFPQTFWPYDQHIMQKYYFPEIFRKKKNLKHFSKCSISMRNMQKENENIEFSFSKHCHHNFEPYDQHDMVN